MNETNSPWGYEITTADIECTTCIGEAVDLHSEAQDSVLLRRARNRGGYVLPTVPGNATGQRPLRN